MLRLRYAGAFGASFALGSAKMNKLSQTLDPKVNGEG